MHECVANWLLAFLYLKKKIGLLGCSIVLEIFSLGG